MKNGTEIFTLKQTGKSGRNQANKTHISHADTSDELLTGKQASIHSIRHSGTQAITQTQTNKTQTPATRNTFKKNQHACNKHEAHTTIAFETVTSKQSKTSQSKQRHRKDSSHQSRILIKKICKRCSPCDEI